MTGLHPGRAALLLVLACRHPATAPVAAPQGQPEQATGWRDDVAPVSTAGAIVVSAHPEASEVGRAILAAGGTAADAAAAVAIALTLVEPQSSGIGGGAFLLHYDATTGEVSAWDGRETAPAAATADQFTRDGTVLGWEEVVAGGLSVGTPGLLRLLEDFTRTHGTLPWADLVLPGAELAERGFVVTPRFAESIRQAEGTRIDPLRSDPTSRAYFYPDGAPLRAGDRRDNPALAATLRAVAAEGARAFYEGPVARHLVDAVHGSRRNPGRLELSDLARYRPVRRQPLCMDYRQYRVCGHPPPTSGGAAVLEILGILERFDLRALDPAGPEHAHLFAEAARVAMADRDRIADPAFVADPSEELLSDEALDAAAARIRLDARMEEPPVKPAVMLAPPACPEGSDTTHLVVVDARGDAVTMTSSIENRWGAGVMVDGFLLNNQLTDFAREPAAANAAAPCKRPRSAMSPTLVFDAEGELLLAIGSPGGAHIIQYTARVIVDVLDHDLSLQASVARPNLVWNRGRGVLELEEGGGVPPWSEATVQGLRDLGHQVVRGSLNSGLHGVLRSEDRWEAGIDPRREGAAGVVEAP